MGFILKSTLRRHVSSFKLTLIRSIIQLDGALWIIYLSNMDLMINGDLSLEPICFFSNLAMLVNGSPMQEIKIQRGLRQGYYLDPFLILLVTEGLSGIVIRASELSIFSRFKVASSNF